MTSDPADLPRLPASHLTEGLLSRGRRLLPLINSRHVGGSPERHLERLVLPIVGGRSRDLASTLALLHQTGLIVLDDQKYHRTSHGDRVAKALKADDHQAFFLAILRTGLLESQVRELLQLVTIDAAGAECRTAVARRQVPQLVAVLSFLPGTTVDTHLRLNVDVLAEIESAWSTWVIPPMAIPGSPEERQQVGDLAELYSLNLERSAYLGASKDVLWVSRDDSNAGYDIEAGPSGHPRRRIEVKGSRGRDTTFILSANEWSKAASHGTAYEIHYWNDIRLGRDPATEYERLRGAGQPLIIIDPSVALASPPWSMAPINFRVSRA